MQHIMAIGRGFCISRWILVSNYSTFKLTQLTRFAWVTLSKVIENENGMQVLRFLISILNSNKYQTDENAPSLSYSFTPLLITYPSELATLLHSIEKLLLYHIAVWDVLSIVCCKCQKVFLRKPV